MKTAPLKKFAVFAHVVRADGPQELDVVVAVELGHLVLQDNNTYSSSIRRFVKFDGCYCYV